VQAEIEADEANITQQPNSNLLPFMETLRFEVESPRGELEAVRAENQLLHIELGNSESEKESFRQELVEVREQLEIERASREEMVRELISPSQSFAISTAGFIPMNFGLPDYIVPSQSILDFRF
jgi:predicted nuclease with TOPRIM domain